ncbi:MAG TPA: helix-turn-helix domain-containing protein [Amycolatopsis sp.]|nr:helix-turn-helix domain-containing protein [Amycolatopsis sp.]
MCAVNTMSWDAASGARQWVALMSEAFAPLEFRALEQRVSATVCLREFGPARATELTTSAACLVRSDREVELGGPPSVLFVFPAAGEVHVEQMGRSATLSPGNVAVMRLQHPALARFSSECRSLAIEIPRNLVPLGTAELVDIVAIALHCELVDITVDLLTSLLAMRSEISPEQGVACGAALLGLTAALAHQIHAERGDEEPGVLDRVKSYIDRHLADPALGLPAVAQGMHVSVRFLHRLFESEPETVTAYIRRHRLEGIRADLGNPELARLTVREVAARWGLTDAVRFGKLFRQSYGETPSGYRRRLITSSDAAWHSATTPRAHADYKHPG